MDFNVVLQRCRELIKNGASKENVTKYMHENNITIIEAIKIYRELYNVSLSEAKSDISISVEYKTIAKRGDELHQKLIDNL